LLFHSTYLSERKHIKQKLLRRVNKLLQYNFPDYFKPSNASVKFLLEAKHVARMGEDRGVHRVLVGKPEGKKPMGRPRRRWENNINLNLQKVGGGCEDWMELAQDRDRWRALVGTVRDFRVP
jgi:hypothetical protein